ncbi:hypothetical protein PF008_g6208 [Phytophthora fragariae]|uniref:Uncharacterized protein n=1 Tax=Phytophthora fragariae TaxID=53985 RepID=A0A6G0S636_9STRA|nr:hypothetical protein PF008_g6208 [Phytophthora fragariae]
MAKAGELHAAVEGCAESEDEDDDILCIFDSFRHTAIAQESFEAKKRPKRGGSVPGKAPNKRRDLRTRVQNTSVDWFIPVAASVVNPGSSEFKVF